MNQTLILSTAAALVAVLTAGLPRAVPAQTPSPQDEKAAIHVQLRTDETSPVMPLTGKVKAYVIESPEQMMPGQFADGFLGDFVLENDLVRAVIGKPDRTIVNVAGGGNLLDLASQKHPIDYINFVQTVGDLESTESQVRYSAAEAPEVRGGTTAAVVVSGTFARTGGGAQMSASATEIDVVTTYSLPKNSNRLLISTQFTNNTGAPVQFTPGDVVDWGSANTFVEGIGMVGGVNEVPAHYVLAGVDDFSVGYVTSGTRPLVGLHTARNSIVQAVPVQRRPDAEPPSAAAPPAAPTRPGGLAPRIVAPEDLPGATQRPPFMPPPGVETQLAPYGMIQPPRPETPYGVETPQAPALPQPGARVTTAAMVLPSSPVDFDVPKIIPGGDGLRVLDEAATTATVGGTSETTSGAVVEGGALSEEEGGKITLAPGQSFTFDRYLVVSDADFSRVANAAYETKNVTTGTVVGIVLEAGTDAPIAKAEILVSGGPTWDRRSPPPAFTKTQTRSDGAYVLRLPVGHYILTPTKTGRTTASGPSSVEITTGSQPRIIPLTMTRESRLRIAVTEADAATSIPVPSKITFIAKPGTMPINWGVGPSISQGIRNVYYMPYGAAVIPVTPGRYQITISRGIEYDVEQGELTITPGVEQKLEFVLSHSLKGQLPGMISVDAGVITSASAVGTVSPADRVVQAAAEGVGVIVTGDYGVATDLQPEIERLGLQRHVKSFPGMRLLVENEGQAANLFFYPVTQELAGRIKTFAEQNKDLPPDVLIADLRQQFPNVILQVDSPLDLQQGYLTQFPFDDLRGNFEGVLPPPDFDSVQLVEGKKWPLYAASFPRYEHMVMARTREAGSPPLSGVGSSGSRLAFGEEVGYPRMYIYTRNDTANRVTAEDLLRAVKGQHYVVTNGPVMLVSVLNPKTGEFDALPGDVVDYSTSTTIAVKVNVLAAPWIPFSNFDVRFNGLPIDKTEVMPVNRVLRYPVQANLDTAIRRRRLESDTIVTGLSLSVRRPLSPVVPATLSDFGGEVFPLAWTAPIFVDKDGDGRVIVPERVPDEPAVPATGDAETTGAATGTE